MFEVEQKFHVENVERLKVNLERIQATPEGARETHSDTYFNHPSRDFGETREALRIRRVNGVPMITYKGSLLPGSIKARRELEWRLDPGDASGTKFEELLELLGFRRVATVEKLRQPYSLPEGGQGLGVVIDEVTDLGIFAEIELIVENTDQIEAARAQIASVATDLGLRRGEPRSYLTMFLERESTSDQD